MGAKVPRKICRTICARVHHDARGIPVFGDGFRNRSGSSDVRIPGHRDVHAHFLYPANRD
jgi:hypothetical protein